MMSLKTPIHGDWGCEDCTFLGSLIAEADYDLYYCPQQGIPTVMARYGPDGQYKSGMCFSYGQDLQLTIARTIAEAKGLYESSKNLG